VFAPTNRAFEDADTTRFHHVQAQTGFSFPENDLTRCVVARHSTLQEKSKLVLGQPRKDGDLCEHLTVIDLVAGIVAIVDEEIPACDISHMHSVTSLAGLTACNITARPEGQQWNCI